MNHKHCLIGPESSVYILLFVFLQELHSWIIFVQHKTHYLTTNCCCYPSIFLQKLDITYAMTLVLKALGRFYS